MDIQFILFFVVKISAFLLTFSKENSIIISQGNTQKQNKKQMKGGLDMKKTILLILTLAMLFGTTACAQDKYTIKYLKSEENYDYGSDTVYMIRDKETNEIIPLSIGPLDGYSYAYVSDSSDFTVEKVSYTSPFTDLGDRYRYESYIHEIASREVVTGFEDGSFKPEKELSRAEMAAVFARMFRIHPSNAKSRYEDVPQEHWARGYIMALLERGVFIQDTYFNPDLSVTREQLVAMTHRMLCDMKYIDTEDEYDFSKWTDFESITEYARKPYNDLMANGYILPTEMVDHDFIDTADDEYFAYPQRPVTRLECCEFLYHFIRMFFYDNAPAIRRPDAPEVDIPILDGSTSTYDITRNIYSAYYQNVKNAPGFPKAHSKTTNSYKRLIDGQVDMIFVPDPGDDVMKYANEKNIKLRFTPIANEALVFFTANKNPVDSITTQQLHEIYVNNSITNWKDLGGEDSTLTAYCRNTDSGSHAQMENFILDGKEINENISKERTSIIMSSILTDVDQYNKANQGKYAMGYSLYYYFQNSQMVLGPVDLKLMKINGIAPTEETIAKGTYPYTTNYYAVTRDGENNPEIEEFIKLMQGEFGDAIAQQSGLGVIK